MSFHVVNSRIAWLLEESAPEKGEALGIPANTHLWMGSGPGLEIKKSQGKDFELEAVRQGPAELGEVVFTDGSPLGFKHLIHAVVMGQDLQWAEGAGDRAGEAFLRECAARKIGHVVTHPFHRGVTTASMDPLREMLGSFLRVMEEGIAVENVTVLVKDIEERNLLQNLFLQLLTGS